MSRAARRDERPAPRSGFEDIVGLHYDEVRRLCAVLVDEASADDLAQETFLSAYRSFSGFLGTSSVRTWLFAVARHTCFDELRARGRRRLQPRPLEQDRERHDHADDVALATILESLEENRRAAFVLTQVFGLSYSEAAQICRCPVGTIRSRLARARKDLIALIGHEDEPRVSTKGETRGSGTGMSARG